MTHSTYVVLIVKLALVILPSGSCPCPAGKQGSTDPSQLLHDPQDQARRPRAPRRSSSKEGWRRWNARTERTRGRRGGGGEGLECSQGGDNFRNDVSVLGIISLFRFFLFLSQSVYRLLSRSRPPRLCELTSPAIGESSKWDSLALVLFVFPYLCSSLRLFVYFVSCVLVRISCCFLRRARDHHHHESSTDDNPDRIQAPIPSCQH